MKELMIYRNWRFILLTLLAVPAFILLAGDIDEISVFLYAKVGGIALAYAIYRLGKYWYSKGKLKELDYITED